MTHALEKAGQEKTLVFGAALGFVVTAQSFLTPSLVLGLMPLEGALWLLSPEMVAMATILRWVNIVGGLGIAIVLVLWSFVIMRGTESARIEQHH